MLTIGQLEDQSLVTFAANDEIFVSGGTKGVRVWRVGDGQLISTLTVEHVQCVAFSKDGKWFAAGTFEGDVIIWDAKSYRQPSTTWKIDHVIRGLDFSPDATRLFALGDFKAKVWNIATRTRAVGPLRHEDNARLVAAKYSPRGDRIAIATRNSVRVCNSSDGHSLVDIPVNITSDPLMFNTSLLWCNDYLIIISDGTIKKIKIDASTGPKVSEWPVSGSKNPSCIAVQKVFIPDSSNRTVTFWDTSTGTKLGHLDHPQGIHSISLSPNGRFLAICGVDKEITIKRLSRITVCIGLIELRRI